MSERGLGCEINYNDAISYYKNCLDDNAYAQYALANIYLGKKPLLSHLNYMQNLLSCLKVRAVKTLTRLMNMQNILKDLYSHIDPPKMTYIFSTGLHLMAFSVKRTMILILMGVYYIKSESCIMRGRVVKGMLSWPINIL